MIQTLNIYNSKSNQNKINILIQQLENNDCTVKDIRTEIFKEFYYNQIIIESDDLIIWEIEDFKMIIKIGATDYKIAEFEII